MMTPFDRIMDKVALALPQMRTMVSPEEVRFVVRFTCHQRARKYPVLMRDTTVIRMLESEVMGAVGGKMLTLEQRIDAFKAVISRAERDPIWALHKAYAQEEA